MSNYNRRKDAIKKFNEDYEHSKLIEAQRALDYAKPLSKAKRKVSAFGLAVLNYLGASIGIGASDINYRK